MKNKNLKNIGIAGSINPETVYSIFCHSVLDTESRLLGYSEDSDISRSNIILSKERGVVWFTLAEGGAIEASEGDAAKFEKSEDFSVEKAVEQVNVILRDAVDGQNSKVKEKIIKFIIDRLNKEASSFITHNEVDKDSSKINGAEFEQTVAYLVSDIEDLFPNTPEPKQEPVVGVDGPKTENNRSDDSRSKIFTQVDKLREATATAQATTQATARLFSKSALKQKGLSAVETGRIVKYSVKISEAIKDYDFGTPVMGSNTESKNIALDFADAIADHLVSKETNKNYSDEQINDLILKSPGIIDLLDDAKGKLSWYNLGKISEDNLGTIKLKVINKINTLVPEMVKPQDSQKKEIASGWQDGVAGVSGPPIQAPAPPPAALPEEPAQVIRQAEPESKPGSLESDPNKRQKGYSNKIFRQIEKLDFEGVGQSSSERARKFADDIAEHFITMKINDDQIDLVISKILEEIKKAEKPNTNEWYEWGKLISDEELKEITKIVKEFINGLASQPKPEAAEEAATQEIATTAAAQAPAESFDNQLDSKINQASLKENVTEKWIDDWLGKYQKGYWKNINYNLAHQLGVDNANFDADNNKNSIAFGRKIQTLIGIGNPDGKIGPNTLRTMKAKLYPGSVVEPVKPEAAPVPAKPVVPSRRVMPAEGEYMVEKPVAIGSEQVVQVSNKPFANADLPAVEYALSQFGQVDRLLVLNALKSLSTEQVKELVISARKISRGVYGSGDGNAAMYSDSPGGDEIYGLFGLEKGQFQSKDFFGDNGVENNLDGLLLAMKETKLIDKLDYSDTVSSNGGGSIERVDIKEEDLPNPR